MKPVEPISDEVKEMRVEDVWTVVFSFKTAAFYPERLLDAVRKSFGAFRQAAGEGYEPLALFPSYRAAHDAISAWIRSSGAERAREGKIL